MALRVLLVALVAALGLEWPEAGELEGWTSAGRAWASARMTDLSRCRVEIERVLEGSGDRQAADQVAAVEPALSGRVDLAFEAAVEGMASDFSADLASTAGESKGPVQQAVASAPAVREMPPASPIINEPGPESEIPASRHERISTAVRLTRQAVDAWASLIQESVDREADEGDSF